MEASHRPSPLLDQQAYGCCVHKFYNSIRLLIGSTESLTVHNSCLELLCSLMIGDHWSCNLVTNLFKMKVSIWNFQLQWSNSKGDELLATTLSNYPLDSTHWIAESNFKKEIRLSSVKWMQPTENPVRFVFLAFLNERLLKTNRYCITIRSSDRLGNVLRHWTSKLTLKLKRLSFSWSLLERVSIWGSTGGSLFEDF